ncbi:hypothetical protein FO488_00230 [Geobacter sp. FeAm09]|uniref:hypothetical protein n=1 Tax=Geobacter sp. FeAm09 TaxID=2597769 RepID=UPI0011ED42E2|nr:hypothetical protein [Geobacter sp. FeAm09]QEM66735.1 hypothetical protein FO488_00230 [Geobacter sp. FeAm09]
MSDELEKLFKENQAKAEAKPGENEPEEMERLRLEVLAAVAKTKEVCTAGEAALSDAYTKLETFATNKIPRLIQTNVEAVTQVEIKAAVEGIMRPLSEGIIGTVRDVEVCRSRLRGLSWNWRLFVGPVAMGLVTVIVGGCLVFFGVLGDLRRYANWGRKVEEKIDTYSPKTREVLFQDFGGRP